MKKTLFPLGIVMMLFLISCDDKSKVSKTDETKKESPGKTNSGSDDEEEGSSPQLLHDISLQQKGGVKVFRAFLADEQGNMIRNNTTMIGEPIFLNINVEKGWEEVEGKTYLGASQKITTDGGLEILDTGDLFASYDETGFSASDARILNLKARITSATGAIDHFVVNFRVWDKKGSGEFSGSYKFKVKEATN